MSGEGLMARALFAAAIGQDVNHIVAEGAPLDALISAVSSTDFQAKAPDLVVWAMAVTDDLGAFGVRPWHEITGLAKQSCRAIASGDVERSENTIDVDLSDIPLRRDLALLVALDEVLAKQAGFEFSDQEGGSLSRTIRRFGLADGTERFLMPLEAGGGSDIHSVRVTIDTGLGDVPSVAICGI